MKRFLGGNEANLVGNEANRWRNEAKCVGDNDGWALDPSIDLKHYNVELEPQNVKNVSGLTQKLGNTVALDGNSQLFLALRDMSNDKFINKLNNATNAPDTKVLK